MKKILEGEQIVKCYGKGEERRTVLDHVSFCVNEGEFVSVMGPSGSGKSTLLFSAARMEEIDGGKVFFREKDLSLLRENELSDLRRTGMGFVFQQPAMLKNLNILDNIILPSLHGSRKNRSAMIEKARLLMKKAGIAELEDRDVTAVSGGQLQRAGILRALMASPEIIFADEPTGALNSVAAGEIMDLFSEINAEDTAVLLVTHDAKAAARAERVLFMCDGKIVSELKLSKYQGADLDTRTKKIMEKMQEIGI